MAPPMRDDRMMPPPPMRDERPMPPPPMRGDDRMTVRDDRGPGREDFMPGRDMPGRDDRMPGRDDRMPVRDDRMPARDDRMPARDDRMPARDEFMPPRDDRRPPRDDRMMPPPVVPPPMAAPPGAPRPAPPKMPAGPPPGNYERYDEPTRFGGGYDDTFEPGRHGKSDMTTELRMPEGGFDTGGFPVGPPTPAMPPEAMRIDQLRRTFQLRRFGSGYDRMQVDRLFEGIVDAMSGRSNVSVSENELDPAQFNLVPGGYFEAEVDAALKEVRDILARRR
jgi:hypothetical protein